LKVVVSIGTGSLNEREIGITVGEKYPDVFVAWEGVRELLTLADPFPIDLSLTAFEFSLDDSDAMRGQPSFSDNNLRADFG
jgi:hypothetical protein